MSTGQTSFFSNYGFLPQFHLAPTFPWDPTMSNLVSRLQQVQQELKTHPDAAKTVNKDQADQHQQPSPTILVNDVPIRKRTLFD